MKDKIKVLHTEWSNGWGGQEIRIITEILAMREFWGVESFIACRENSQISQKAKELDISTIKLNFASNFDIKTIFSLIKFIKQNKIDIVNTHSGKDTWTGGIAAKMSGAKFIRTRHLSNPINPSRLNFINQTADFVLTTGSGVREMMIENNRINPEKIISVPTGIDEEIFNPNKYDKGKCRQIFGFEKDKIYVGFLGVLRSVKRPELFLKTAIRLNEEFPNLCFVLAGDGPNKNDLQNFIKKHNMQNYAELLGHQSNAAEFLKAIDIYALTSQNEGVPQALIQALLMQKPSLATNVGSVGDLYNDENFKLVKFDENSIFYGLRDLVLNFKGEISEDKFIKNNFTKEKMANRIYEIYQKILGVKK